MVNLGDDHTRMNTSRDAITPTDDLINRLFAAQLLHTSDLCINPHLSDDGLDYIQGALELASVMLEAYRDHDLSMLNCLLNTPPTGNYADIIREGKVVTPLGAYACDGVASAFYDLNCIALEEI